MLAETPLRGFLKFGFLPGKELIVALGRLRSATEEPIILMESGDFFCFFFPNGQILF